MTGPEFDLAGKKVLVVGLARSGRAAIDLALRLGAHVIATDRRPAGAFGDLPDRLIRAGVELVLEQHPPEYFTEADLVVVSPGVPSTLPGLVAARDAGVEVVSELELAFRCCDAPVVAVTGTNGKSTTTTFIGHFLRAAGRRVFVGGNLGTPFCEAVQRDHDIVVVEVSSFQLEWIRRFRPKVGILLNVTEDHLDRYQGFAHYAETKGRVFARQDERDFAVVNRDDPVAMDLVRGTRGTRYLFGHGRSHERGIYHEAGTLWFVDGEDAHRVSLEGFRLRGRHNVENLMAAYVAAHLAGVPCERLDEVVPHLEGLPHRLELVAEVGGIRYYNDSKATNVRSVECSLRDLTEPLILLMGGKHKGGSYAPLEPIVARQVKQLILFGEARSLIRGALGHLAEVVEVETLADAVACAGEVAEPGDSVVLSPGCSSFDQFSSYEERGDVFRRLVWEQTRRREGGKQDSAAR